MRRHLRLTWCALVALVAIPVLAQSSGDSLYQQGDYVGAQRAYQDQMQRGPVTAGLLYNLGNASYQLQQLGYAILYYERAMLAAPRDPDLRANLEVALAARHTPPPGDAPGSLQMLVSTILDRYTLNELAVTASLLFWAACGLLFWWLRGRQFRRRYQWLVYVCVALALCLGTLAGGKAHVYHNARRAVIVADGELYSGPAESFQVLRKVYQGELTQVTAEQGVWRAVTFEAGATGWVRQSVVERVFPLTGTPQPSA